MWRLPCHDKNAKKNIQHFIFKAGDSINDQKNDNMPNEKLKALYNTSKAKWMMNYGTPRFQPHHMKYVLVETRESFMVSAGNIIRDSSAKTQLSPLRPSNKKTNTQACIASTQAY